MAGASTATSTVLDYFAQVLRREPLEEVTFREGSAFIATPREQIAGGSLTEEHTRALFDAHDRDRKRPGFEKGRERTPDPSIPVAISLVSIPAERGATQHGLLLLGATLRRDGHLEPELETGTSPWIPAERLGSPSVTDREVMAGPLRAFWEFALAELGAEVSRSTSIAGAMKLAGTLFRTVSGHSIEEFAQQQAGAGRRIEHGTCYVQEHERINAVGGLLDVYEALAREDSPPPILERMVQGWDGPRIPESRIHDGDGLLGMARLACGSMSEDKALTASQRRAVHAFLQGGDGEVTAVSGPPGTGKTTMLQAIVAGMITRRALNEEDAPVIVGTSTNNQAVTNIIASFASVTKQEPGTLDLRWLPQAKDGVATDDPLRSLAVYCPSRAKLREAKKQHLVEQKDRSELYADHSSAEYLAAARDHFLFRVQQHFGGIDEPARVREWIHDALTEVDGYRLALLGAMSADGQSEDYLQLCDEVEANEHLQGLAGISALRECESLEALDEALDRSLRYAEFWLAVHFYEAQWLLAEHLGADERFKSTWTVSRRIWPQAAALTPCFVMTLYQVPKFFGRYTRPGEPRAFDVGRIDLLIVDEAGQVDTPLGLPALALAQRALVVGDEKQLSPVWSLDEETDREIADGAGIGQEPWAEDLRQRGMTCSAPSSLMRAASHASRWSFGDGAPGLLLREHFRCHPRIIGFSNALLYDGLLDPRRPAESSKLEGIRPAFEWIDVPESEDSRQGASRVNRAEAEAIAAWIIGHYAQFFELYHHRESRPEKRVAAADLLGVVTPFSAQATLIEREIRRAARAADPSADLPTNLAQLITVGTAHRLQGAERPIILFSAVYGTGSPQAGFIDANPELMNVAVSRAQDLLVVFAAPTRWDSGPIFSVMSGFATRAVPEAAPATAAAAAQQGTLSTVLGRWREAGELREGDAELSTPTLNQRLADAGVLVGRPGAWEPTRLAAVLGVLEVERSTYTSLEYTPQMQELLLELYRSGRL